MVHQGGAGCWCTRWHSPQLSEPFQHLSPGTDDCFSQSCRFCSNSVCCVDDVSNMGHYVRVDTRRCSGSWLRPAGPTETLNPLLELVNLLKELTWILPLQCSSELGVSLLKALESRSHSLYFCIFPLPDTLGLVSTAGLSDRHSCFLPHSLSLHLKISLGIA